MNSDEIDLKQLDDMVEKFRELRKKASDDRFKEIVERQKKSLLERVESANTEMARSKFLHALHIVCGAEKIIYRTENTKENQAPEDYIHKEVEAKKDNYQRRFPGWMERIRDYFLSR